MLPGSVARGPDRAEIKLRLPKIGKVTIFHAKSGPTAASDRSGAPKRGGSELDRVTPGPLPSSLEDVVTAGVDRAQCALPGLGRASLHCLGLFLFFYFFFNFFFLI